MESKFAYLSQLNVRFMELQCFAAEHFVAFFKKKCHAFPKANPMPSLVHLVMTSPNAIAGAHLWLVC